jgi:hypothetical protein
MLSVTYKCFIITFDISNVVLCYILCYPQYLGKAQAHLLLKRNNNGLLFVALLPQDKQYYHQ